MSMSAQRRISNASAGRRRSGYIDVEVERTVSVNIIDEMTDEQFDEIVERRATSGATPKASLLSVYEEFVRRGDAPQCLREYIYEHLGRVL